MVTEQIHDFDDYLPDNAELGLLKIDFHKVKAKLKPNPKDLFERLKRELPKVIRSRLNQKKQWIQDQIISISSPAIEVSEYVRQVQALEFIDHNFQKVKDVIDVLQNMHNICTTNGIEITKEDQKLVSDIYQYINKLGQQVMEATESIDNKKKNNIEKVKKEIPVFRKKLHEFRDELGDSKFLDVKSNLANMQEEMRKMQKKNDQLVKESKMYQEYQTTLEMEIDQFVDVDDVRREVQDRVNLWDALSDWSRKVDDWKDAPFAAIDTETISKEAEKYTKIVVRCERGLPEDSSAVHHLRNQVFEFKATMPIVTALGNKNLKEDHWQAIKEISNIDLELENKDFSLGELMARNIAAYQEDIQDISTRATQEAKLQEELTEILNKWNILELTIKPYKEQFSVISELEELQIELDDSMTNINNILGNRYVAKLRQQAQVLFDSLSLFLDIFDQWKDCQRNWLYLENIFVSDDIRAQTKNDYLEFEKVNKRLLELMKGANKNPKVKNFAKREVLKDLKHNNEKMDAIQKSLENFLEQKRLAFPRFFFLSNDELLQILAAAQDIKKIEKHLNKIFENIMKLELGTGNQGNQIQKMISAEGEQVAFMPFVKLKLEDKVETTLSDIETRMYETILKKIQTTHQGYDVLNTDRNEWVVSEIGQVITTVSQIIWTELTETYIDGMQETRYTALDDLLELIVTQLEQLTVLIRGKLDPIKRKILISLITADVHNRDIVNGLAYKRIDSIDNFEWQAQLRYYNIEGEPVHVKQVNATLKYGGEYLGATSRLVITPLTDRCWLTITGALHIKLGAAPAGPAGTGKTESTKDLAKALGVQCIVFNCSEQIDYKMMARLFSGLVSQGAWACLDEFNRINEEVLSVIAQQLLTIRFALLKGQDKFLFGDNYTELTLNNMCGVFVTMNPGYAGRTELPDNLASLFRPVSMMIPNYGLIAEIMLFAEGFKDASSLSKKMVQLYKLASEQLSQQKHYDFGMRAVKSVLVMAGSLKRENPTLPEDVVLIRAMRDSNIPKFLAQDLPLFKALIQDLFPKVIIPEVDYGELQLQIEKSIKEFQYEDKPEFITKVIQLFDIFNVRFGAMIVGPTGGGKTTCYEVLAHAMTSLRKSGSKDARFQQVFTEVLNPKSITMGELYGQENPDTKEWTDGLASKILRESAKDEGLDRNICVFDGPVDALWIENMNTVLDDTMALCLANGERIKLKPSMRILFEAQDLAVASPATVSRCGMVYMTPTDMGWIPYVNSWMKRMFQNKNGVKSCLSEEAQFFLRELFDSFVDETLVQLAQFKEYEPIPTVEIQAITCLCNFLEYFVSEKVGGFEYEESKESYRPKLTKLFAYSFIWGLGCSYSFKGYRYVDQVMRRNFSKLIPPQETVFEYCLNLEDMKFTQWKIPEFEYDPGSTYFSILVPTIDTCRYSYFLDICIEKKKQVFFTGETGVGKSVIIQKYFSLNQDKKDLMPIALNFSAQTDSFSTQQTIESKLEKKRGKTHLGAKGNNTCVLFIDDVNMPSVEEYGAQPPIELLRQLIGFNGFYDRSLFFKKYIENFVTLCSAAPPSGGRAPLTPRFTRFFHIFCLPQPNEETMITIFDGIVSGFLIANKFSGKVAACGRTIVTSTIDLYNQVTERLLPTPSKFHYTFNLRDISKVFQGFLMCKPISVDNETTCARLWMHEVSRVFYDRLINEEDREFFTEIIEDAMKLKWRNDITFSNVIFSNLLRLESDERLYEEIAKMDKLHQTLMHYLEEYNTTYPNKMNLVFFSDAVYHICRIVRVLLQPRGNAMLIGVSGCGKQSLTKLASFMLGYENFSITLSKNYKPVNFREDLKEVLIESGCKGIPYTFLLADTQIIYENFLEDINNILNTGDITNLYDQDDMNNILADIEPYTKQLGRPLSNDVKYATYIERLRDQFHIILCMSPVGDLLRIRCRMFPSLVNCCTLDWYDSWSEEALLDVSTKFISEIDNIDDDIKQKLANMCPFTYKSVEKMALKFDLELRRKVYITPKSFLDSISMYKTCLEEKRLELNETIMRLSNGLHKLSATNVQVADLKQMLTKMRPELEEQSKMANAKMNMVKVEKKKAEEVEQVVEKEANEVSIQAMGVKAIKDEVELELDIARPAQIEAEAALEVLNDDDINEVKSFPKPPDAVVMVLEAVLVYFRCAKTDWKEAKKVMSDNFKDKLKNFQVEKVPPRVLDKVRKIIFKPDFDPALIEKKAKAAACLAKWCIASEKYAVIRTKIKPLEEKLAETMKIYDEANGKLATKKAELKKAQDHVQRLEKDLNETLDKIQDLNENIKLNEKKLERAAKLIDLTKEEGENWKETVGHLKDDMIRLIGDVFLGTASISYIGPFTGVYRDQIISEWIQKLKDIKIPSSENYKLTDALGDPVKIRTWKMNGLPSDTVSVDNGIM